MLDRSSYGVWLSAQQTVQFFVAVHRWRFAANSMADQRPNVASLLDITSTISFARSQMKTPSLVVGLEPWHGVTSFIDFNKSIGRYVQAPS